MFGFGKKKDRLKKMRVAILAADGVEQGQLDAAVKKLRSAGAEIFILSLQPGKLQAFRGLKPSAKIPVDATLDEVHPASFGALFIPGGTVSAERLRQSTRVLEFVRSFDRTAKPIAVVGHGALVLVSAGVLRTRRLTAWPGIKDDVINTGAEWLDEPYALDGNLLTGRTSRDIGKFTRQIVDHFASNRSSNVITA
ncbi:MAG TPA: DJ-1/PfpI family protein [Herpetosiphonaceae bacterium]